MKWIYRNIWQGQYDPRDDDDDIEPGEVEDWRQMTHDYNILLETDRLLILSWKMGMSIHIYARVD